MAAWLVLAFGLQADAAAKSQSAQTRFSIDEGRRVWAFDVGWLDARGQPRQVAFELPTAAVHHDQSSATTLPRDELDRAMVEGVRAWSKSLPPGSEVTAKAQNGGISVSAQAPTKADVARLLEEAHAIAEEAKTQWMATHDTTRMVDGALSFDHAALAASYAVVVGPIADALTDLAPDPRAYTELALSFVQAIPYEARTKKNGEVGYRRPLAVLARNQGDCDSKSVLFLALVRAAHPELELAVVYVPNHALTGIALPPAVGDRTFKVDGLRFVYAEPVGPALHPLGTTDAENKKAAKRGEIHLVQSATPATTLAR